MLSATPPRAADHLGRGLHGDLNMAWCSIHAVPTCDVAGKASLLQSCSETGSRRCATNAHPIGMATCWQCTAGAPGHQVFGAELKSSVLLARQDARCGLRVRATVACCHAPPPPKYAFNNNPVRACRRQKTACAFSKERFVHTEQASSCLPDAGSVWECATVQTRPHGVLPRRGLLNIRLASCIADHGA
jgi:hypothetical protein